MMVLRSLYLATCGIVSVVKVNISPGPVNQVLPFFLASDGAGVKIAGIFKLFQNQGLGFLLETSHV